MAAVRLGKNHLRWCDSCNLPLLERKDCPLCGESTREVEVTPPADVRPAFDRDLELIRLTADEQFGEGCGEALLPSGRVVLLNKVPALDRMDEVIVDGEVVGALRYDLGRGHVLVNRLQGAKRMRPAMSRGYVESDPGALPFIREGKNLMAPGVIGAADSVRKGDEVVVTAGDEAVATGLARMDAAEMLEAGRGVAVKTKWTKDVAPRLPSPTPGWDEVLAANEEVLSGRAAEACDFIRSAIERHDLPAIVSFSGGKDSLATLLLTLDAGLRLPLLFVDTGLEFDETVQHVEEVAERHGLELIVESAPVDAFFGNLVHFGPPSKDYRWCCKTNKLGPTVGAILKNFPDGVLSFIGQRRYESEARRAKSRVWRNPWTPGQVGASPIQEWNALHVWMYIMSKGEDFNPWYRRGLDRIGCFLCPASDMAELEAVAGESGRYRQWTEWLQRYRRENGLPEEWERFALWRWKRVPASIREELETLTGKDLSSLTRRAPRDDGGAIRLRMQEGASPCVVGYSIEGSFSRSLDLARLASLAGIMGPVELREDEGWVSVDGVTVYEEGVLTAKGPSESTIRTRAKTMHELVLRSEECVGCSLCVARCPRGSLALEEGKVTLGGDCDRCGRCLEGPCPASSFRDEEFRL